MDHRPDAVGVHVSGKVTVKDRGAAEMMRRARALAKGPKVRVGILADASKKDPPAKGSTSKKKRVREKVAKRALATARKTLLEVAVIHEFGGGHVPARSFIRATIDEREADITKLQTLVLTQVLAGKVTIAQGLAQIGAKVASWVQARIVAGIAPPLAESTKRLKARHGGAKDTPLILSGQLKSAITYAVQEAA